VKLALLLEMAGFSFEIKVFQEIHITNPGSGI
jgi:hypothetical protein